MTIVRKVMVALTMLGAASAEAWADGCGRATVAQRGLEDTAASTAVTVLVPLVAGAILFGALRRWKRRR